MCYLLLPRDPRKLFAVRGVIKKSYRRGPHSAFWYSKTCLASGKLKKLLASAALIASAAFPLAAEAQYGWSSGSYYGWGRQPSTQTYQRGNGWGSGSYFGSPRTPSYGSSGGGMNYRGMGIRDCSKYIRC
jgi:hypothetical protein